jgi:hypothetical protein
METVEDLIFEILGDALGQEKLNLGQVSTYLKKRGWESHLSQDDCERIAGCGFRQKNLALAIVATEILKESQPLTLRGLFYRVVSAGWLPSTDSKHYHAIMRVMSILREAEVVPFSWLVDGVRQTNKPASWSGIADFTDTVRELYRKDFWARLPVYVHVFCEKDAMAGMLTPTTREYDVSLSIVRGYSGISYLHEAALQWREIEKPIFVYYLGDFDPAGLDLERDIREKMKRYSQRDFSWERLAVNPEDFSTFNLFPLKPKALDTRTKRFLERGYTECAELDAVPAPELRARIEQAILQHIPAGEWEYLQKIEELERKQWNEVIGKFSAGVYEPDDETYR